ncbi:MAG: phosphoribosylaminoimidazolesuccinocarboxamide synthase [Candidatus Paceibacterota bacterium]|jgi:phosphoribosylaminoimidazole-succinocarboxamide synthase
MEIEKIKEHIDDVLKETNFPELGKKKAGKVRDIYDGGDRLTLIATDRHSSFDRVIAHIPFKGEVLNQISLYWFEQTKDIVPNHVISTPDPNITVGKKMKLVPVEAVMRGYLTGVTDTSIWTRYQKGLRQFGDLTLPDGLKKNTKLPNPIFDPTTKEDTHDRAISPDQMIEEGLITKELLTQIKEAATKLFLRGQELALKRGLILVDTKYEFGTDENGKLVLIDEIHTPDSSRYWNAGSYEERFEKGEEPEYFDKEFLRLWFKENCDPYKDAILPEAPKDLVAELSRRYIEIFERITGQPFEHDFSLPVMERITKNLKK